MDTTFIESSMFTYFILPFLIFLARIVDVSLDTLRIIFLSRGNKIMAPILGFFAVLVWLLAITRIMANLDNVVAYLAYPLGFAVGNYFGLYIEEKLAIGIQIIRIITGRDSSPLISELRDNGYATTVVDAEGKEGPVHIIFLVVKRINVKMVIDVVNKFNPRAFYSIEDVRSMSIDNSKLINNTAGTDKLIRIKKRI